METVTKNSTIPVIKHDKGVCHIFVDGDADVEMALRICVNAKVQRPSTCNAMETLLVHQTIARNLLPALGRQLDDAPTRPVHRSHHPSGTPAFWCGFQLGSLGSFTNRDPMSRPMLQPCA